jgi:hypothetical protein
MFVVTSAARELLTRAGARGAVVNISFKGATKFAAVATCGRETGRVDKVSRAIMRRSALEQEYRTE